MSYPSIESLSGPEIEIVAAGPCIGDDGVRHRVWAPDHAQMAVRIQRAQGGEVTLRMERREGGYFEVEDAAGVAGDLYRFVLADGRALPDPASRFQPEGVHGPSEVIDARGYPWRVAEWTRPGWRGQSIYELHVGTFTPEGTFRAAIDRLDHLAALGVKAIELMPLADFPGRWNWGYDGVALFAPARCYGRPDDLRAFVDAAHERGLAVILDVVYNHFGPDGNYLGSYAREYFHADSHTPWGQALNFSGDDSKPVRDFFVSNAIYWLDEFRFDGLRLDATHAIEDRSPRHLLAEIADAAHRRGAFVIAEDERNSPLVLRRENGEGLQIDAVWADDFHHQVRVALTGVQESYFQSYRGSMEDLARTIENGWFYVGQSYPQWKGRPRGEPGGHLPASAFVYCIENHDQVGNRARGERLEHLISASAFRAASALLCLSPHPPLIFMGQEWAASTPFMFFTDHHGELGKLVSEGRRREFGSAGVNYGVGAEDVPDPQAPSTFQRSQLAWDELRHYPHSAVCALYRACLEQRAQWLDEAAADRARWTAIPCGRAIALRYRCADGADRLVVSSLEGEARIALRDTPELRAPEGREWRRVLESNEDGTRDAARSLRVGRLEEAVDALVFDAPGTVLLVALEGGRGRFT